MSGENLDRSGNHEFRVHQDDRVNIWQREGWQHWNLSVETAEGGKLRLYNLTDEHLASLSTEIAEALGRTPEITREHVEQCHRLLGRVLGKVDTDNQG
jgi:hypothetical protein